MYYWTTLQYTCLKQRGWHAFASGLQGLCILITIPIVFLDMSRSSILANTVLNYLQSMYQANQTTKLM